MEPTKVYLIRHGEAEPKVKGIINKDPQLTNKGEQQAKEIAKELSILKGNVSELYTSNHSRAKNTAKIVGKKINKKPIEKKEFRELNRFFFYGSFFTPRFWRYYKNYKKACKLFNKLLKKNKGKTIIFIISGRRAISLIGFKLGLSINQMKKLIKFDNCHVSSLTFYNTRLYKINYLNKDFRGEIPEK